MSGSDVSNEGGLAGRIEAFVEAPRTQIFINLLIILNGALLALETSATAVAAIGGLIDGIDRIILGIFVLELALKLIAYRSRFFRDPWNLFDTVVVAIALFPATEAFSVLRALRILRVMRLVSTVPSMRRVVGALLHAVPGMGSIVALLAVVFFVFSVMSTRLFGEAFPDWFGTIGLSAYTLFQVMTLESWSMGIVRPVMEQFPLAWIFFIPFILFTSFAVLNLFIGIIVDAMQVQASEEDGDADDQAQLMRDLQGEVRLLREEISAMRLSRRD